MKRNAKAVIDGELVDLEENVIFEIHHKALNVLAPKSPPG
jgi:diacylglycerol kinase family enzyme